MTRFRPAVAVVLLLLIGLAGSALSPDSGLDRVVAQAVPERVVAAVPSPPPDPLYDLPAPAPSPETTTTTTTAPPPPPPPKTKRTVAAAPPAAGSCGGWLDAITAAFGPERTPRACRIMMCESGGNPTAQNPHSTASGLFQFLRSTWANYAGYSEAWLAPPLVQIEAAAALQARSGWGQWVCR